MRYIYAIYALITFVIFFLLFFPLFLFFGQLFPSKRQYIWYSVKVWSYIWMFLIGMPIRRHFAQKLSKDRNYIVVGNHSSFLDTPMIFRAMPFPTVPLATAAYAKIPIFGYLYKKGAVLVNTKSESSRKESVEKLVDLLAGGHNVFLFPEGSINTGTETLNRFYDGAFKLSIQTRKPILPILFPDTRKRWKPQGFWHWQPGRSRTDFLQPIMPEGKTLDELKAETFHVMKERLEVLRGAKG